MKTLITSFRSRLFPVRTFSSRQYWNERYEAGGNSGPGSYGHFARFKAEVLNQLVRDKSIESVVEFGCGDGNQLALADYPKYTGYDISPIAVKMCRARFSSEAGKEFFLADEYDGRQADLTLSLDVIFHLVEDGVFDAYMRRLFDASRKQVVIYSSDTDKPVEDSPHVRHRKFTRWIERELASRWTLAQQIPNAFPYDGNYRTTSFSDFFIYEKR